MTLSEKIKHIAALAVLAAAVSCRGGPGDCVLASGWEFLGRGDISYEAAAADAGWVALPQSGFPCFSFLPAHGMRNAWLRGVFDAGDDPARFRGLTLGQGTITGVYINGKRLSVQKLDIFAGFHFSPPYALPENLLTQGKNEVYVQMGYYHDCFESFTGGVSLRTDNAFLRYQMYAVVLCILFPFGLIVFFFGLVVLLSMGMFQYIKARYFISSSVICMLDASMLLVLFLPNGLLDFSSVFFLREFILLTLFGLHVIVMIFFFQSLYGVYTRVLNMIVMAFYLVYFIVLTSNFAGIYSCHAVQTQIAIGIAFMIIASLAILRKIDSCRPDVMNRNLIILIILFTALTAFLEYFLGTGSSLVMFLVMMGSFTSLLYLYMGIIGREVMRGWIEFDRLYGKLKNELQAIKKTASGDVLPVTDQAQLKLKKVIEFVDENFTCDISREGLAAAVDLSPNYMSRLFISYKGKTINEYINELRIKFAIERLENSDQKVLDIALEAGYENLTTFNRAFKKIAGRTPSEYRLTLP